MSFEVLDRASERWGALARLSHGEITNVYEGRSAPASFAIEPPG